MNSLIVVDPLPQKVSRIAYHLNDVYLRLCDCSFFYFDVTCLINKRHCILGNMFDYEWASINYLPLTLASLRNNITWAYLMNQLNKVIVGTVDLYRIFIAIRLIFRTKAEGKVVFTNFSFDNLKVIYSERLSHEPLKSLLFCLKHAKTREIEAHVVFCSGIFRANQHVEKIVFISPSIPLTWKIVVL